MEIIKKTLSANQFRLRILTEFLPPSPLTRAEEAFRSDSLVKNHLKQGHLLPLLSFVRKEIIAFCPSSPSVADTIPTELPMLTPSET